MKIGIITGHFMPEVGYQEVYLSRAFTRLGYNVRVFTSTKPSPSKRIIRPNDYQLGLKRTDNGYEVCRLKPLLSVGAVVLCKDLKKAVFEYSPDIVVFLGIGKIFPFPLLYTSNKVEKNYKIISLFGDNSDFFKWDSLKEIVVSLRMQFMKQFLKKWIYRMAIQESDKVYLNTPETGSVISKYLSEKLNNKLDHKSVNISLGYDPDEFYFDINERNEVRSKLNIGEDELVLISATRVTPAKNIEKIIDVVFELHKEEKRIRYIIIGFIGDRYEEKIKLYMKSRGDIIFYCYQFMKHNEIRKFYNASDIGIWIRAAISIQEAMGTGLPVILQDKPSVNHLVQEGINGWYYEEGKLKDNLETVLNNFFKKSISDRMRERIQVALKNKDRLSYNSIAQRMISDLKFHFNKSVT